MISESTLASPGGSSARSFQIAMRLELVKLPSSSAKQAEGRRNTSVWMLSGLTSLKGPWFCQNSPVSVSSGSMMTRYFSLDSAPHTFFLLATEASGLKPWQTKPVILPWCMRSKMASTS